MAQSADHLYRKAKALPLLTAEQEIVLATRAKQGDTAARETLINSNIRLAYKVAIYFGKRNRQVDVDDLISSGLEGLAVAADRFDPTRGHRFSTYAMHWIKQRVRICVEHHHSRIMRVPRTVVLEYISGQMDPEQAELHRREHHQAISIDGPSHNGEGLDDLHGAISMHEPSPVQLVEADDNVRTIVEILNSPRYTPLQRTIFLERAGLGICDTPQTFQQIADTLGMNRVTVCNTHHRTCKQLLEDPRCPYKHGP